MWKRFLQRFPTALTEPHNNSMDSESGSRWPSLFPNSLWIFSPSLPLAPASEAPGQVITGSTVCGPTWQSNMCSTCAWEAQPADNEA